MNNVYLEHHGIKGQRWGVRRYQNKDGSLTPEGIKKYRKEYDEVATQQRLAKRTKSVNAVNTPSSRVNSRINDYNEKYYNEQANRKLKILMNKIGDKGIKQLDEEVIKEGKKVASEVWKETERLNNMINFNYGDNYLFYQDPKKKSNQAYNEYIDDKIVKR